LSVEGYQGLPYRLAWSPDSRWLAFSEDAAAQALESDIWLFDVSIGSLENHSDDGIAGRYADAEGEFALDYLPMWDPATGYLYFWRSTPDEQSGFGLDLMRLDPDSDGAPVMVQSYGKSLGDGLLRFGWQRFYLQGPSAISPDGSQLAVAIAPSQEMDVSEGHALWLIDLVNVENDAQQVATALAWQSALPQWSNQPAVARGLQWTADGKGVVVAALSSDLRLPLLLTYYVDVESGEVTPVIDFSDSRDREAFFRLNPTTGHAPRFDVPWTVALVPDTNVLLLVTDLGGGVRILGAPLPPTGTAPMLLREHRSPGFEAWTRSSAGGGRVLVYGMVMDLVSEMTPLE
jgi:Tol biopolymer transport system component